MLFREGHFVIMLGTRKQLNENWRWWKEEKLTMVWGALKINLPSRAKIYAINDSKHQETLVLKQVFSSVLSQSVFFQFNSCQAFMNVWNSPEEKYKIKQRHFQPNFKHVSRERLQRGHSVIWQHSSDKTKVFISRTISLHVLCNTFCDLSLSYANQKKLNNKIVWSLKTETRLCWRENSIGLVTGGKPQIT